MQEYRYSIRQRILIGIAGFFELLGVRRPIRYEPAPAVAGDYNHALHVDHPEAPSILAQYLDPPIPAVAAASASIESTHHSATPPPRSRKAASRKTAPRSGRAR
jgi:hypothetical protein